MATPSAAEAGRAQRTRGVPRSRTFVEADDSRVELAEAHKAADLAPGPAQEPNGDTEVAPEESQGPILVDEPGCDEPMAEGSAEVAPD